MRVALITGAFQGIGRSIAHRLSSDGFHVMLNDLPVKREALLAVVSDINSRGEGGQASMYLADVSVEGEVKEMIDEAAKLGSLDVVSDNPYLPYCLWIYLGLSDGCKCRGHCDQTIP